MFQQIIDFLQFIRTNAPLLRQVIAEVNAFQSDADSQALMTELQALIETENP